MRKTNLERLLARRPEGIFASPFERGKLKGWGLIVGRDAGIAVFHGLNYDHDL